MTIIVIVCHFQLVQYLFNIGLELVLVERVEALEVGAS